MPRTPVRALEFAVSRTRDNAARLRVVPRILFHGAAGVPRASAVGESLIYGDHYVVEALTTALRPDLWEVLVCSSPA
jgi:hypothetical protein